MSDPELREALEALNRTFSPLERWPDLEEAIAIAERMDQAVDDEAVRRLILELQAYVEARAKNAQRVAVALRVFRMIAEWIFTATR